MGTLCRQTNLLIDENGSAWINAEDAARGLGFISNEIKNDKKYTSIRWSTLNKYLQSFSFLQQNAEIGADDFIPENMFYRLAFKAHNDAAERFQAYIADEVFPAQSFLLKIPAQFLFHQIFSNTTLFFIYYVSTFIDIIGSNFGFILQ